MDAGASAAAPMSPGLTDIRPSSTARRMADLRTARVERPSSGILARVRLPVWSRNLDAKTVRGGNLYNRLLSFFIVGRSYASSAQMSVVDP
jgi:hypothetical protein